APEHPARGDTAFAPAAGRQTDDTGWLANDPGSSSHRSGGEEKKEGSSPRRLRLRQANAAADHASSFRWIVSSPQREPNNRLGHSGQESIAIRGWRGGIGNLASDPKGIPAQERPIPTRQTDPPGCSR